MSEQLNCRFIFDDSVGLEVVDTTQDTSFKPHTHLSSYVFTLVAFGTIRLKTSNELSEYIAGTCFYVKPNHLHSILSNGSYRLISVCLDSSLIKFSTDLTILIEKITYVLAEQIVINLEFITNLVTLIKSLWQDLIKDNKKANENVDNLLLDDDMLDKSLDELSMIYSKSKFHFLRCFKERYEITPHKYLLEMKIHIAKRCLAKGYDVTKTAYECYFFDEAHFIKQFKEQVKLTPKRYLKSLYKID